MPHIEERTGSAGTVWRVRFRHTPDGHQRAINKALTFGTVDQARTFVRLLEALGSAAALVHLEQGAAAIPAPTVVEYAGRHVANLTGVTEGTRTTYRAYIVADLEPHFGDRLITGVTAESVSDWLNWLERERKLGGKSIRNRHALLSATMGDAVAEGLVTANPCKGKRLPRTLGKEMVFLTRAEFGALFDAVPEHFKPFVLTLVATGTRFGEATALTVGDVDLDTHSIRIRQAWKATGTGQRVLGVPKSRKSVRTVAMPTQVSATLQPLIDGRPPSAFLFTGTTGGPIRQATFWKNVWQPAVVTLGGDTAETMKNPITGRYELKVIERGPGKHPRVHDLRHTYASWAMQSNVPLPVLQRQLGHESITTTVDTYGHLARSDFDALAATTAAFLPPAMPQPIGLGSGS